MSSDFLINGSSAAEMGIRMGNGFLDSLETPASLKDYITNTSRLEDGDRIIIVPKRSSRELTLEFVIIGEASSGKTAHESYEERKDAFLDLLYSGMITISVPSSRPDVYRLYTQMKSPTYSRGVANGGVIGKVSVKFLEANPANRG